MFRTCHKAWLWVVVAAMQGACTHNAIIYGEGTNFSLASVRLNDDVAQPISINVALDRTIAAIAPPGPDGEAVNMISGFKLDQTPQQPPALFDTLTISTVFASGSAAKTLAETNPKAAATIMNLAFVEPASPTLVAKQEHAIAAINKVKDQGTLNAIAKRMGVLDYRPEPRDAIVDELVAANEATFSRHEAILKDVLKGDY